MRTRTMQLRLSEEELAMLEKKAKAACLSKSVFIRHLIEREKAPVLKKAACTLKNLFGGLYAN